MKANEASFLNLLGVANQQFVIPVYQRVYSWTERQCQDLWEDVIRAGRSHKPHFIGSVLYIPEADSTATHMSRLLLIDGQQRMTTLSLVICALVKYLEDHPDSAGFLGDRKVSSLRKDYLFNDDSYLGDSRYKLILSKDDKETLFSLVGDAARPEDYSRLIVSNYEYFTKKMAGKSFEPEVLWEGLSKVQIIDAKLSTSEDNAQLIFESMNSKGKPLTPIDLIRNYILMSLPNEEQTRLYEGYWRPIEGLFGREGTAEFNAFIWYWLWLKVPARKPREDEAYDEFKRYCEDDFDGTVEELLQELEAYARRYANMFLGHERNRDLAAAFKHIKDLDVRPVRPLMLALYALFEDERLPREGFLELCGVIESFLFRRAVCGLLTTGLNNFFAGMYRELETQGDVVTYVKAMLLIHKPGMTAYFPTDADFEEAFRTRDCYQRFTKTSFYLERIENSHHPKEPVDASAYQIEHILPQAIVASPEWKSALGPDWEDEHDRLCNTLGNLTFTGYNPEYSNFSFSDKLNMPDVGFKCSPLYLNRWVAQQDVWNARTIDERASLLLSDAERIWPYPCVPAEIVERYRPSKVRRADKAWTLEDNHPLLVGDGPCRELFEVLCQRIEQDDPDWERYVMKYYVGFRTGTRRLHVMLEGRSRGGGWLALGLSKTVDEIEDPKGLCKDKRGQDGFGPGLPTYVALKDVAQVPEVMALINQCG